MSRLLAGAAVAALLCLLVAVAPAHSQDWNAALTLGLTEVEASLVGNTWTFALTNQSDLVVPEWNVLVWSLEPFNVPEPSIVTMPDGWEWKDTHWEQYVVDPSQKYFTPPALAPGQNYAFTLSFDLGALFINVEPSLGGQVGFLSHVGAVVPGSGSADGTDRWDSYTVPEFELNTWHDRSRIVPEPTSLLALASGLLGLGGVRRMRKR